MKQMEGRGRMGSGQGQQRSRLLEGSWDSSSMTRQWSIWALRWAGWGQEDFLLGALVLEPLGDVLAEAGQSSGIY